MTDKEIIIDGVNVTGCVHLLNRLNQNTDYCCKELGVLLKCCERDCYYKQLQRKSQECEELKEDIKIAGFSGIIELCHENKHYKQALEKIKDYCIEQLNKHFNHCKHAKGCVNACGIGKETLLNSILNLLNEVADAY